MKRILLVPILLVTSMLYAEKPAIDMTNLLEQIPEIGKIPETIQIRNALIHEIKKTSNGWEAVITGEIHSVDKNGEDFLFMADHARLAMAATNESSGMDKNDELELEERLKRNIGKQGWILVKKATVTQKDGVAKEIVGEDVSLLRSKKDGGF